MAQQTINNGETGLSVRTKLNDNFDELYAADSILDSQFIFDVANYSGYLNPAYNSIEEGLRYCWIAGGGLTQPNIIGSTGKPLGTGVTPPDWADDSSYVSGAAEVAVIGGGYDNVNNQIAGVICGGGHNFVKYNVGGHSVIVGGSYNVISGSRGVISGGQGNAITGTSSYGYIGSGQDNQIDDANYAVVLSGNDNTVTADRSFAFGDTITVSSNDCLAVGRRHSVTHASNLMIGEDGVSYATRAINLSAIKLKEAGDYQTFTTIQGIRTSNNSTTNMGNAIAMPAGKVVTGNLTISVIATRDGSADGNNDGDYSQASWFEVVGFRWDGTNGLFYDTAGTTTLGTSPSREITLVRDNITVDQGPRLRLNTGSLRMDVKASLAAGIINWVARVDAVITQIS